MDHFLVATLFIEYYQARAQGREEHNFSSCLNMNLWYCFWINGEAETHESQHLQYANVPMFY